MDVRTVSGEKAELKVGMWYVGVNWLHNLCGPEDGRPDPDFGAIAQYVGDGEFYDDEDEYGECKPVRMQDYEYIMEQNMGRL